MAFGLIFFILVITLVCTSVTAQHIEKISEAAANQTSASEFTQFKDLFFAPWWFFIAVPVIMLGFFEFAIQHAIEKDRSKKEIHPTLIEFDASIFALIVGCILPCMIMILGGLKTVPCSFYIIFSAIIIAYIEKRKVDEIISSN